MDPTKPRRLAKTRIFLAGIKANLTDTETIGWMKENKITKVFCLYPLKEKQFVKLKGVVREHFKTLKDLYDKFGVDPAIAAKLRGHGIATSSLIRSPEYLREFRGYESFLKEARKVKHNFLIQCFGGWHASGAYAMYYLAAATPMTLPDIREKFLKSAYKGNDIVLMERFFDRAHVDIKQVIEKKLARIELATKIRAVQEARKREIQAKKQRPKKKTKKPYKRRTT